MQLYPAACRDTVMWPFHLHGLGCCSLIFLLGCVTGGGTSDVHHVKVWGQGLDMWMCLGRTGRREHKKYRDFWETLVWPLLSGNCTFPSDCCCSWVCCVCSAVLMDVSMCAVFAVFMNESMLCHPPPMGGCLAAQSWQCWGDTQTPNCWEDIGCASCKQSSSTWLSMCHATSLRSKTVVTATFVPIADTTVLHPLQGSWQVTLPADERLPPLPCLSKSYGLGGHVLR